MLGWGQGFVPSTPSCSQGTLPSPTIPGGKGWHPTASGSGPQRWRTRGQGSWGLSSSRALEGRCPSPADSAAGSTGSGAPALGTPFMGGPPQLRMEGPPKQPQALGQELPMASPGPLFPVLPVPELGRGKGKQERTRYLSTRHPRATPSFHTTPAAASQWGVGGGHPDPHTIQEVVVPRLCTQHPRPCDKAT